VREIKERKEGEILRTPKADSERHRARLSISLVPESGSGWEARRRRSPSRASGAKAPKNAEGNCRGYGFAALTIKSRDPQNKFPPNVFRAAPPRHARDWLLRSDPKADSSSREEWVRIENARRAPRNDSRNAGLKAPSRLRESRRYVKGKSRFVVTESGTYFLFVRLR
jgi:hypothetical protein